MARTELSRKVQKHREELCWSIERLAKHLGIGMATLWRIETDTGIPNKDTADRIFKWLETGLGSPRRSLSRGREWCDRVDQKIRMLEEDIAKLRDQRA